jgi:ABC-2 type transport system ATP-binding protein
MILGLTDPTSGKVRVSDIDPTSNPIEVKRKVGYLSEDVGFYYNRNGLENLVFTARLNGISYKDAVLRSEQLLARVGLSDAGSKKTGKYSRGMLQRLGLADVLIKDPEIIILDEPTLGLDPKGVKEFLELIIELSKEKGLTVLFSSHDLYHLQQVCDRVGLFVGGKLVAEGNIQAIAKKLFDSSPYIIEAGVGERSFSAPAESSGRKYTNEWLREVLAPIDGISKISLENEIFHIECNTDLSREIASAIVGSGAGLFYLNKKEYGLNDIYYHYFEGTEKVI